MPSPAIRSWRRTQSSTFHHLGPINTMPCIQHDHTIAPFHLPQEASSSGLSWRYVRGYMALLSIVSDKPEKSSIFVVVVQEKQCYRCYIHQRRWCNAFRCRKYSSFQLCWNGVSRLRVTSRMHTSDIKKA